jgi:hypothetical protein
MKNIENNNLQAVDTKTPKEIDLSLLEKYGAEVLELPYLLSSRSELDKFLGENNFVPVEFTEAEDFSKTSQGTIWAPGCRFPNEDQEVLIMDNELIHFKGKSYWHAGTKLLVKKLATV